MPGPKLGCGGTNQPPCPPENAALIKGGVKYYTLEQMQEHGYACYQKGLRDTADAVNSVLDDPGPAWGDGELARAVRKAINY